jgi:hypothetical protein
MNCRRSIVSSTWACLAALIFCNGCVYFRGPSGPAIAATPPAATTIPANPVTSAATPAQTAAILAEVQQLGTVDPVAQNALLEAMKKTDPSLWPQLVQTFRASIAYHQEIAQRERPAAQNATLQANAMLPVGAPYQNNSQPQTIAVQPARYADASSPEYNKLQPLPESSDATLSPKFVPAEFVASYPNTHLPEVHLCAAEGTPASTDWHDQLAATIKSLETGATPTGDASSSLTPTDQRTLRMLYLAAGRRDDALRPLADNHENSPDQNFWSEELSGLAAALDEQHFSNNDQRAAAATEHLRNAANTLGQSASLVVRNLAFCTEVLSYGMYKPLPKYELKPGQEVILYAEIDNFISQATDKGYHTALKSRYRIVDSRGVRIAEQEYPVTEEWCKNPRRDYFVRYFLYMPGRIAPGNYTLELAVEDTLGNKIGQSSLPFSIASE